MSPMKLSLFVISFLISVALLSGSDTILPVKVITDGFNCKEGIIVADELRALVKDDSLLKTCALKDSSYLIIEITSYQDGPTVVVHAAFSKATLLQTFKLDYVFSRRLVSRTLQEMQEISANIVEKVHVIRNN